eukprot:TRINITY_DN123625_c0_g1_i1.p1 TRINITY_DN123625_c0_g1~~TRINITY_DN123625_c0_g1_i1.p1  ORF type:complete len:708 (+),score=99.24 TRINITY_DN123625_c0_g1_i1:89-2212(+)
MSKSTLGVRDLGVKLNAPKKTIEFGAPQTVEDKDGVRYEVEAPYWGLTIGQFGHLLAECQMDSNWQDSFTMRDLVENYVKPKTKGKGVGYALLVNNKEPLEVSVMISHAWAENVMEFYHTLHRSVGAHESMFICALSLYQCEDGYGPSIEKQLGPDVQGSPFWHVIQHIAQTGQSHGFWWTHNSTLPRFALFFFSLAVACKFCTVIQRNCISFSGKCYRGTATPVGAWIPVFHWEWNPVEVEDFYVQITRLFLVFGGLAAICILGHIYLDIRGSYYLGRMIATPNHQCPMYTRLWCVYEMFVARVENVPVVLANTLASTGPANCKEADCSSPEDAKNIKGDIRSHGEKTAEDGFELVDAGIRAINRQTWMDAVITEVLWGFPIALADMCVVRMLKGGLKDFWMKQLTAMAMSMSKTTQASWQEHLAVLTTHGRFGYDIWCETEFEESRYSLWVWALVCGVLVGCGVFLSSIVYVARKAEGNTCYSTWFKVIGCLVAADMALSAISLIGKQLGYCDLEDEYASHVYRMHWFFVGTSFILGQGALIILTFLVVNALFGKTLSHYSAHHGFLLMVLGCVLLVVLVAIGHRSDDMMHMYPTFFFNFCLLFGFFGPLSMGWTAAVRWGMTIVDARHHRYVVHFMAKVSEIRDFRTKIKLLKKEDGQKPGLKRVAEVAPWWRTLTCCRPARGPEGSGYEAMEVVPANDPANKA